MEELLKLLNSYYPLSAELQVALITHLSKEIHRKNKLILEAGQVCDWIGFVEKGLIKTYYECPDGSERVVWFHREGDIIGSMKSFYHCLPSKISIRTIEETFIRKIRKTALEALYDKYIHLNINGRKITEQYYTYAEDHVILMGLPPKERFLLLKKEFPRFLNDKRIKDYMLAAFLGIDKATMSRYRNAHKRNDPGQLSIFD